MPSGSKSIALSGRGRTNRNRVCSGGTISVNRWAAAPRPFEVDIFRPPMLRNSYGKLSGGSRSKTSRAIASERSRDPPAVARSLPLGSIVTPNRLHCAAHSRFQGSFAVPPNGDTRPVQPQPVAHSTRSGRQATATVSPSQSDAIVVPTLPQLGQIDAERQPVVRVLDVGDAAVDLAHDRRRGRGRSG